MKVQEWRDGVWVGWFNRCRWARSGGGKRSSPGHTLTTRTHTEIRERERQHEHEREHGRERERAVYENRACARKRAAGGSMGGREGGGGGRNEFYTSRKS